MKRSAAIFMRFVLPLVCVGVLAASGWLWHRSVGMADYFYRVQANQGGWALKGFGSCRGVCLFGTVFDSLPRQASNEFQHEILPLTSGTKGSSVLAIRPSYKTGGWGFGVSHGELALNLPLASFLPKRTYHVVYVPYYFIMLVAMIPLVRWVWQVRARAIRVPLKSVFDPAHPLESRCGPRSNGERG